MKNPFSEKSANLGYIESLIGPESTNLSVPIGFSGFQCPHCLSYYQQIDTLNNHIDHEHPNDFIECSICDEKFKYPNKLSEHIRKYHPYEPEDTSKLYRVKLENNKKSEKRRVKQKFTLINPPCFGQYKDDLCHHCLSKKKCKDTSIGV